MADKILYIIRGVPGSGKSTMAHKLSPIVVESDDFMMDDGEYKYDPKKVHYCHKKCFETVENHLKNGEPTVAVANTFIKKSLYEPYVELANKYGYKVIIRKADGNYQNIHNVPNNVVSSMKKRFQECINSLLEMNSDVEITETNDNFKKWFGNSKVVDENGKPLAVYHGWNKEFEEFILQDKDVKGVKCAFFSSDINTAASYSEFGNVRDFYLRIENPLIYDANFSQYYIGKDSNHIMVALNKAKKGNYDGVIIKNIRDDSYQEYEEGYEIPYSTTYIVFNPNQIKSVNNNGNWSLDVDNINEEKEVIEERLFPELSDRKYNELLWFTSPNMTANAYTKFFGKEMVADRIPAKYLVSIGSRDQEMLNDLVLKHKRLRDAGKVRPIADYNDFEEFVKDLNASKYLSRKDKSNVAKSGANIIKSFGNWDMYAITSWSAAKKYGAGTTWCVTTGNTDSYFNKYVGGGESDSFGGYNTRKLFFVINPEKDRKFAISVSKTVTHDWYTSSIEFYNETDDVFYEYNSTVLNLNLKDNISDKFNENNADVNVDEAEYYGEDESFFIDIMKYIIDEFKMNKDEVIEDIERLRQKFKQKLGINESANKEEQILSEGVNQHSLYHGCDLAYAVSMMIDNAMRGETIANINGKKYQGNSLTRSLQFAKDWQDDRWDGYGDELNQFWVVLEFNKERLKTKYKVLPYNYWEEYFGQDYEHTIDRNGYGDQYEEFVVGRINNLRNYLDDVYLSDECIYGEYAEILAIVKRELELRGEDYSESDIEEALQQLGIDKPSPDDFDVEELNENYDGMPMVYPNPTYSEFHDIMRRFTTTGKLSAIIDGDDIYCWDSYLKHHDTMIRYIENKMDIKISDNAIWVRFKEPNKVWVSGAYFNDYDNDELEDLETQDFEEELKYNPVIRKYFPKGVKVVRYDRLDEEIVYAEMINDEMITILKNPTRKELQDNGMMKCRIAQDWDGNFYFVDSYDMIHTGIVGKLESEKIKSVETNLFYDTNSNTFYYNVGHLTDDEIKKYSEREEKYLRRSLYISKTFKDFHFKIIFGEL